MFRNGETVEVQQSSELCAVKIPLRRWKESNMQVHWQTDGQQPMQWPYVGQLWEEEDLTYNFEDITLSEKKSHNKTNTIRLHSYKVAKMIRPMETKAD